MIYTPYYEIRSGNRYNGYQKSSRPFLICEFPDQQYADLVHVVSPDGETLRTIDLIELFGQSETFSFLLSRTTDRCDPLHLNYVDIASSSEAAQIEWLEPGDMLLSFRSLSSVAVINSEGTEIKKVYSGTFTSQHSAQFGDDGRIYLFDNMGTSETSLPSRLVSINMRSGIERIIYSRSPEDTENAELNPASGNLDINTNTGRALMAYTQGGRITEIDIRTGKAISVFDNWHGTRENASGLYKTYGAWFIDKDLNLPDQ